MTSKKGTSLTSAWLPDRFLKIFCEFCVSRRDNQQIFLGLNPCGEFFWLERTPGLPISNAIADLLLSHSPAVNSHKMTQADFLANISAAVVLTYRTTFIW